MAETEQVRGTMKKVMLAGVGAAALIAEKSQSMLEELAEKGAATVEQGKVMNEELKHKRRAKDTDAYLDSLTPEQMEELKEKILQREADGQGAE